MSSDQLPLPIAHLVRRARNAKSPKERHDTAYFAWEASIRLGVAAGPPEDSAPLALPSIGHWVRACKLSDRPLDAASLLALYTLLSDVGSGKKATPKSITPRKLVDALPAYRNQVLGHGAVRANSFYDDAANTLLDAVAAAWSAGMFLPSTARIVFVESVEVGADGTRRGRTLSLSGLASTVEQPGTGVALPDHILPKRLYVRTGDEWRSLHPWLLFREDELRERVWFFNARKRSGEYLDYASGELLKGKQLTEIFPHIDDDLEQLFGAPRGGKPGAVEPKPEDPDQFGDYRILGKLGEGGMGVVYLARQQSLDRIVALKMLPPALSDDATAVARFQREIAALSRCDHPNVIKILASGEARGTHYYAMEYVDGADLAQVATALSRTGDLTSALSTAADEVRKHKAELFADVPEVRADATPTRLDTGRDRFRQIAELIRDAARGLHHLHEAGILHRDIKPANLMLTADDGRVVLMDLGLASVQDASRGLTKDATSILGTLRYMAPEQLQRNLMQVDRRADVFALGASLWELLTDRPLRDGDSEPQLVEQVLRGQPAPANKVNTAVPSDLSVIAGKATDPDPKLRYDTAETLADDLDAWLEGRPITARPPTIGYLMRLWIRRHRAVALTAAAALLLMLLGTATFIHRLDAARRVAETEREKATQIGRRAQISGLRAAASEALAQGFPMRALMLSRELVRADRDGPGHHQILLDALATSFEHAVLEGHETPVSWIAVSPDGSRVVTGSWDDSAQLWNADGDHIARLAHDGRVWKPNFTSDSQLVTTASSDATARIWRASDGRELLTLRGQEGVVLEALPSNGGDEILTYGDDTVARLWTIRGELLASLVGHDDGIAAAAFSPDNSVIATASKDETVRLWSPDGRSLAVIRGLHGTRWSGYRLSVSFSPVNDLLLITAADGAAGLWSREGALEVTLGDDDTVVPVATFLPGGDILTRDEFGALRRWSPDGRALMSFPGTADAALLRGGNGSNLWDVVISDDAERILVNVADGAQLWDARGRLLRVLSGHAGPVRRVAISADGKVMATASYDRTARLWNPTSPSMQVLLSRGEVQVRVSGNGRRIITEGQDGIRFWDLDGHEIATIADGTDALPDAESAQLVDVSDDGTEVLIQTTQGVVLAADDGSIATVVPNSEDESCALSADARFILTRSGHGARLFARDGHLVRNIGPDSDAVNKVGFSPDNQLLWTATRAGEVQLWDPDGREAGLLSGHTERIFRVVFSPDGTRIVTSSRDRTARIWDRSGRPIATLEVGYFPVAIDIAPDGRVLTGALDGNAYLWDANGKRLAAMNRSSNVWTAYFSPNGELAVTAYTNGDVCIWDADGKLKLELGHDVDCPSAAFLPDGRRVVTGCVDGTARIWHIDLDDLMLMADQRIRRSFTAEELALYADLIPGSGAAQPAAH